jgi:hypothetical protein
MSSTDLAPAHTTATAVRPSSVRSADTSMLASPPRCTPPMHAADGAVGGHSSTSAGSCDGLLGARVLETARVRPCFVSMPGGQSVRGTAGSEELGQELPPGCRPPTSCHKHGDARPRRQQHGGRHGGGAVHAQGHGVGQVAAGHLAYRGAAASQPLELRSGEAHVWYAPQYCNRGWHGSVGAHYSLHLPCSFQILRVGHAVADDGAFQRHHRAACRQRRRHLGAHHKGAADRLRRRTCSWCISQVYKRHIQPR